MIRIRLQFWIIAIAVMQIRIRKRIQLDPDPQRGSNRIHIRNEDPTVSTPQRGSNRIQICNEDPTGSISVTRIQPDPDLQRGSSRIQIRNFVLYPHVRLNPCLDEHLQVVVERSLVLKQNVQRVIYSLYTATGCNTEPTSSKGTLKQNCFNLKRYEGGTDLTSILSNRLILFYALAIFLN